MKNILFPAYFSVVAMLYGADPLKVNKQEAIAPSVSQKVTAKSVSVKYNEGLQKVFDIKEKIKDIHPFLSKIFPIAVTEDNRFFIFDVDSSTPKYLFVKEAPTPMAIDKGIRAAFSLDCYENKMACVVSGEVFDDITGYSIIFHEFMHCQQFETCELKLKKNFELAQKSMAKQDYMWELMHPFPYADGKFIEVYSSFLQALAKNNTADILKCRTQLKQILSKDDFEYMVWQEWKEGFARFVENKIKQRLGLKLNHYGSEVPFERTSFYEGGSRYIAYLDGQEPKSAEDIEKLFHKMLNVSK